MVVDVAGGGVGVGDVVGLRFGTPLSLLWLWLSQLLL